MLPLSYGQSFVGDQGEMLSPDDFSKRELANFPKEDLVKRIYVMVGHPNRPKYGDVLLRFPKLLAGKIKKDVDYYILQTIPPEYIEQFNQGKWIPIG